MRCVSRVASYARRRQRRLRHAARARRGWGAASWLVGGLGLLVADLREEGGGESEWGQSVGEGGSKNASQQASSTYSRPIPGAPSPTKPTLKTNLVCCCLLLIGRLLLLVHRLPGLAAGLGHVAHRQRGLRLLQLQQQVGGGQEGATDNEVVGEAVRWEGAAGGDEVRGSVEVGAERGAGREAGGRAPQRCSALIAHRRPAPRRACRR